MSDMLFDTSVIVADLRKRIDGFERAGNSTTVFICTPVLGELWHGVLKATNAAAEQIKLDALLAQVAVLHPDEATAKRYGSITAALERQGRMIPANDIWIAAIALECGLPVATRDPHFQCVDGLQVLLW